MTTQPQDLSSRPDATDPSQYAPDPTIASPLPIGDRRAALADQARSAPVRSASGRPQAAPASLRGKKYDITLAKVEQIVEDDGSGNQIVRWRPRGTETETVGLAFDNNSIADIEDEWGSSDEWQKAMDLKPAKTLRDSLAIALGREPLAVGAAMLIDQRQDYIAKIGLAFSLANGVDPTQLEQVYKLLDEGVESTEAYKRVGLTPPVMDDNDS